jgi:hypothetical protein
MTNAAKSGAEITRAFYAVKKKVKGIGIRELPTNQGIPGRHEPPEDALAASARLPCSILASDSAISTLWFAGLNNSSTRFNSTA